MCALYCVILMCNVLCIYILCKHIKFCTEYILHDIYSMSCTVYYSQLRIYYYVLVICLDITVPHCWCCGLMCNGRSLSSALCSHRTWGERFPTEPSSSVHRGVGRHCWPRLWPRRPRCPSWPWLAPSLSRCLVVGKLHCQLYGW